MGDVVVSEFITLDGVIEAPGGGEQYEHASWSFEFKRGDAPAREAHGESQREDGPSQARRNVSTFTDAVTRTSSPSIGARRSRTSSALR